MVSGRGGGFGSMTVTPAAGNPSARWFNHRELKMLNLWITAPGELRLAGAATFVLGYRLATADL